MYFNNFVLHFWHENGKNQESIHSTILKKHWYFSHFCFIIWSQILPKVELEVDVLDWLEDEDDVGRLQTLPLGSWKYWSDVWVLCELLFHILRCLFLELWIQILENKQSWIVLWCFKTECVWEISDDIGIYKEILLNLVNPPIQVNFQLRLRYHSQYRASIDSPLNPQRRHQKRDRKGNSPIHD